MNNSSVLSYSLSVTKRGTMFFLNCLRDCSMQKFSVKKRRSLSIMNYKTEGKFQFLFLICSFIVVQVV